MKEKSESGRACELKMKGARLLCSIWFWTMTCAAVFLTSMSGFDVSKSCSTIIKENNVVAPFSNLTLHCFVDPIISVMVFNDQFLLLPGNKRCRCCPGVLLAAPPPLPLCDWQPSISVNHQPSPFSPTPRLCSVSFKLVLGATLSDGETNDFSLASLHSHTETRRRADGAASAPNAHHISTRKPLKFTDEDSPQKSGVYWHPLINGSFHRM